MRLSTAGSLSAMLFSFALGCSTTPNPGVCCTTQADCDALGVSEPRPCTDGLVCQDNACVLSTCEAVSDCTAAEPYCAPDNSCAECLESSHCDSDKVCDQASYSCVECVDDSQCGGLLCDTATNTCASCTEHSQCTSGLCELDSGRCLGSAWIVPRYLPEICDTPATASSVKWTDAVTIDTALGSPVCTGGIFPQINGPELCVIRAGSIKLEAGATVSVKGSRVIALVSDGTLLIEGTLDVGANRTTDGPGGGTIVSGGAEVDGKGGGGSGFRTIGGSGASLSVDGGANNGGSTQEDPSSIAVLVGGPRSASEGGGGGGAASLISCRGTVDARGIIDAGGGGGGAGRTEGTPPVQPVVLYGGEVAERAATLCSRA